MRSNVRHWSCATPEEAWPSRLAISLAQRSSYVSKMAWADSATSVLQKASRGLRRPRPWGCWVLWGALAVRAPDHHAPHGPSGEDAGPYPHPGLDEGRRFLRVRGPSGRRRGQGVGRAEQGALVARRPALAFDPCGWQVRECGREEETSDHIDVGGQGTSEGLGRIAAIGRHADGAGGGGAPRCGRRCGGPRRYARARAPCVCSRALLCDTVRGQRAAAGGGPASAVRGGA